LFTRFTPGHTFHTGAPQVVTRNILTSDWYDEDHEESLLNASSANTK
jgi:hypothetical protein